MYHTIIGESMLSDFKMIVCKLPREQAYCNLYPLADVHIGSAEFNEQMFKQWLKTVSEDEYGVVVMAGDLMNMGIKSSKTNVYEETMRPRQQKEYLYEALTPIKDKIVAACGGNHCYRNIKEVDDDPLYDVMAMLRISEVYRQNICFAKICVGTRERDKKKQIAYGIVLTHGSTTNKHNKFINGIDGADLFVSGHVHQNAYNQPSKIRMDMQNETVRIVPYRNIVCGTFQESGGYSIRAEYMPVGIDEFQVIRLDGTRKRMNFFTI